MLGPAAVAAPSSVIYGAVASLFAEVVAGAAWPAVAPDDAAAAVAAGVATELAAVAVDDAVDDRWADFADSGWALAAEMAAECDFAFHSYMTLAIEAVAVADDAVREFSIMLCSNSN